ncbi:hypothetical protein ACHAPU_005002 [Fusarium lateritium]
MDYTRNSRLRSSSQPRLPFQGLEKTSALLRAPGPLDGMLKTTTETGGLDLFPIKPPSRPSSAPYYGYGSGPRPSRTPSQTLYPPSSSPYHQHVAGDQSIRSASLTSIVEMYHTRSPVQPLPSPGSFYYDYTEEFDTQPSVAGSSLRETNRQPRNSLSTVHFEVPDSRNRFVVEKGQEPNRDSGTTHSTLSEWASDMKNQQDTQKAMDEPPKEDCLVTSTLKERGSAVRSSDSSLSEWAWPEIKDQQDVQEAPENPPKIVAPCPEKRISPVEDDAGEQCRPKDFEGHHRQNLTNANINVDMPTKSGRFEEKQNNDPVILSPNPISPARQLRVTNSIPQLMKALPCLPHEAQRNAEPLQEASSRDGRAPARVLFTKDPSNTVMTVDLEHGGVAIVPLSNIMPYSDDSTRPSHDQILPSTSRFKIRARSPGSAGLHSKWSVGSSGISERSSSNPVKPRLKLKVSRNRMSSGFLGPDGTIVRRAGPRQHSSLLELKDFPQRDVKDGEALENELAQLVADKRLPNIDEGTLRGQSQQFSDQFDISYPPSTNGTVMAELETQPKLEREKSRRYRRYAEERSQMKTSFWSGPRALPPPRSGNRWSFFYGPRVMPPPRNSIRIKKWVKEAKRAVQSLVRKVSPSQSQKSEG